MAPSGPTLDKAKMGLPDRWLHCPKTGALVNELFFPFKTPLTAMYDNQIPERRLQFHPSEVFSHPYLCGKKIGLWIDLTNTDRYYFPEEVTETGCVYKKMRMAGRGMSPTEEETKTFIKIAQDFNTKNPDKIIGIHCTHGFNRTGFLIAAYLYEVEECAIDAAIGEFAMKRDGGIYKQDYINDLFDRYDPTEEDRILAPEKPDWEREYSGMIGSGIPSTSQQTAVQSNGSSTSVPNKPGQKQFMDGLVGGVKVCEDPGKKSMLQAKVQQLCKYTKSGFPGLQPVSLSRDNIKLLEQEPYMVSWKADGMRYIVYIHDGEVYAFDRDNEVFELENLDFVTSQGTPLIETVVDTEVIIDKHYENGQEINKPRMLIYDIMRFNNFNIMKEPFSKRFEIIQAEIIDKRINLFKSGRLRPEKQLMSVRRKDFWDYGYTSKLFKSDFTKTVGHEIDGLIFQPRRRPYETGRCDTVLKWKPPSHNSVDFLLKIEKICRQGMLPEWKGLLYVQNQREPFAEMKATATLKKYDNKIIECTLIVHPNRVLEWKFMRERTDKSLPNGLKTAENVLDTMLRPVTQEYLLEYIAHCLRVQERKRREQQEARHHHENGHPESKRPRV